MRATDKRVRFVRLEAYAAAGGYVLRDLFEDDQGGFLQDVALLDRLVDEKLKAEGARIGEEGWKWIAVAADFPYDYDDDMRVIDGDQPEMTDEDEVMCHRCGHERGSASDDDEDTNPGSLATISLLPKGPMASLED